MDLLEARGFTPVVPPVLVREEAMFGTGFFPTDRASIYALADDDLFLVGTSEVPLAGLGYDRILEAGELPMRYAGISTCFRREAGAAGRDTRGIFRVHQFDKVEMFTFADAEHSSAEHLRILGVQEEILVALGLHYRVQDIAIGDLGASAARKFDCEAWMPGQEPVSRGDLVLELHRLPGPSPELPHPDRRRARASSTRSTAPRLRSAAR